METKTCHDCKEDKPVNKYYTDRHGKPSLRCMPCYTAKVRARQIARKAESLRSHMIPANPYERYENV